MAIQMVELNVVGETSSQEMIQRYVFRDAVGTGTQADLVTFMSDTVLVALKPTMTVDARFNSITIRPVYPSLGLATEYDLGTGIIGTASGNPLPVTVTYSIQWTLGPTFTPTGGGATGYIRRGGKHLGGCPVSSSGGDGSYNGSVDTALETYIGDMVSSVPTPWTFVIASLPDKLPASRYCTVTGGLIKGFGTQNTRKPGRGA